MMNEPMKLNELHNQLLEDDNAEKPVEETKPAFTVSNPKEQSEDLVESFKKAAKEQKEESSKSENFEEEGPSKQQNEELEQYDNFDLSTLLQNLNYDPDNFPIINDDGNIEGVPFNELDYDSKINILGQLLQTTLEESDTSLNNEEQILLNQFRNSNLTVTEFLKNPVIEANNDYSTYTYDEVFALDYLESMKDDSEFNSLSEAEQNELILEELHLAKDSRTFEIKMEKIKQSLIKEQSEKLKELELQREREQESAIEEFVKETSKIDYIGPVEVEDESRDIIYNRLFVKDEDNMTQFEKDLLDPEFAFKSLFYAYSADNIINKLLDDMELVRQQGIEEGKRIASGKFPTSPSKKEGNVGKSKFSKNSDYDYDPNLRMRKTKSLEDLWKNV